MSKNRSPEMRTPAVAPAGVQENPPSITKEIPVQDSPFHTFRALSRTLEQLEVLGVSLRAARGVPRYEVQQGLAWKQIGLIGAHRTDGRIVVVPREGLTERETRLLLGFAEDAFRNPPSEATGWVISMRNPGWWEACALISIDEDEAAEAFADEAQHVLGSTPVATADQEPIKSVPTERAWEV